MAYARTTTVDTGPAGDTIVQGVTDLDTDLTAIYTNLNTHEALTETHGATGAVVGTTNTQTLTNKTLTSPTISGGTITSPTITGTGAIAGVFTGNVTGNVTGNLTGNVTGNVTGDVTGNVTGDVTGSITGGTGSLSTLTLTAGKVVFPATQSASSNVNTLDDYEEGEATGTPTATTGTFTSADYALHYTKIGRMVAIVINVHITTVGSATGYVVVPLPFTAVGHAVLIGREREVKGYSLAGSIGGDSCIIYAYNNLTPIGAGHSLDLSGVYHTAT